MECIIQTNSGRETERIAEAVGHNLTGGEIIELVSDLGGGKTTFVRGLAHGFGSDDKVASPTFTISKLYKSGQKELHHFDFYRLKDAGVIGHELHDLLGDKRVIIVIEWAKAVRHVLPEERLIITLKSTGENQRTLTFTYPQSLDYLVEDVC